MEITRVHIKHVRRRVQRAQAAIQRQRVRVKRFLHALRQHDLHNVAFGDVVLGLEHGGLEGGFAE